AKDQHGQASVAFSQDAGRSFGAPIRLDDKSALGRVDVELMADGTSIASWIETIDQRAQFRARHINRLGARSPAVTVSSVAGTRASGYPRVASTADEILFAWTESVSGVTQVRTATARLPRRARRLGIVLPAAMGAVLMSVSTVVVALNAQLLHRIEL